MPFKSLICFNATVEIAQSVTWLATNWTTQVRFPSGVGFSSSSPFAGRCWEPPTLLCNEYWRPLVVMPREREADHCVIIPRCRIFKTLPPTPLYAFMTSCLVTGAQHRMLHDKRHSFSNTFRSASFQEELITCGLPVHQISHLPVFTYEEY